MIRKPILGGMYLPSFSVYPDVFISCLLCFAFLFGLLSFLFTQVSKTANAQAISSDMAEIIEEDSVCNEVMNLAAAKDLILHKNRKGPVARIATPQPPPDIDPIIQKYADQYKVDSNVLKKIAKCESGFRSHAVNGVYGGMYQFLSSTWVATRKRMNLDPNAELRFNAEEAIKTAAYKIAQDGIGAWPVCGKGLSYELLSGPFSSSS